MTKPKKKPVRPRVLASSEPSGATTIYVDDPIPARWATLVNELQDACDNLAGVAQRKKWRDLEHRAALAALYEGYIERLSEALRAAEIELSRERTPRRSGVDLLVERADTVLHLAEIDGEKITKKEAVRRALELIEAINANGTWRSDIELKRLVEGKLESSYQQYLRKVRRRRTANKAAA